VVGRSHHVAGEQRDVVAEAVRDLAQRQVRVGNEQELRLSSLQGAERLSVAEDPGLVALVELLAPAEEALPAGGAIGAEDAVTDRDPADVIPRATTSPTNSWPITKPGSIWTRPW
jgi:hypothetical protein